MKKFIAIILVLAFTLIPLSVSALIDLVNEDIKININKAAGTPVIDGKLDEQFYTKINTAAGDFLYYDDDEYDPFLTANVPDFYLSYDANNVYVFLSSTADKYYYCDHDGDDTGNIWNQSCIQVSLAAAKDVQDDHFEMGLARNHETGEQLFNCWAPGGDADELGVQYAVVVEGGRINYEMSIPWTVDGFLSAAPGVGGVFGLNFIYGYSDDGNRIGVEYSAGCNKSKDADLFAQITVSDELTYVAPAVVEPDEPVVDDAPGADDSGNLGNDVVVTTPPPSGAAQTGDAGMLVIVLMTVIAAAGVVVLRRKAVK